MVGHTKSKIKRDDWSQTNVAGCGWSTCHPDPSGETNWGSAPASQRETPPRPRIQEPRTSRLAGHPRPDGCGSELNRRANRRLWSMCPLTRVPFGNRFFEPQPYCQKHALTLALALALAVAVVAVVAVAGVVIVGGTNAVACSTQKTMWLHVQHRRIIAFPARSAQTHLDFEEALMRSPSPIRSTNASLPLEDACIDCRIDKPHTDLVLAKQLQFPLHQQAQAWLFNALQEECFRSNVWVWVCVSLVASLLLFVCLSVCLSVCWFACFFARLLVFWFNPKTAWGHVGCGLDSHLEPVLC